MTTTQQAAALDAAALAVEAERELRSHVGSRRLEDVDPQAFTLSEWSDGPMPGHEGLRLWVRTNSIEVYDEDRETIVSMTLDQAVRRVLDFRAEDPQAAHERDIAAALRRIDDRRSGFENAWRRLSDRSHPAYRAPGPGVRSGETYDRFTHIGSAVWDRDLYSHLLAMETVALDALRAIGPHQPQQGRLF